MNGRKPIVTGVKKIRQDAPQVEVHEARLPIEQKQAGGEHLFEWDQQRNELSDQLLLLGAPLLQTTAAELAFLVPNVAELIGDGDELAVVDVVQFETHAFQ